MNLSSNAEFIESISTKFSNVENEFDTLKIKVKPEEWVETAKQEISKYTDREIRFVDSGTVKQPRD